MQLLYSPAPSKHLLSRDIKKIGERRPKAVGERKYPNCRGGRADAVGVDSGEARVRLPTGPVRGSSAGLRAAASHGLRPAAGHLSRLPAGGLQGRDPGLQRPRPVDLPEMRQSDFAAVVVLPGTYKWKSFAGLCMKIRS